MDFKRKNLKIYFSQNNNYESNNSRNGKKRIKPSGIKLKSKILKLFLIIITTFIFSIIFTFLYSFVTQCNFFNAKQILITGNNKVTKEDILYHADIYTGKNIFDINIDNVRKKLNLQPWIKTAQVERKIPSNIIINIVEHEPLSIIDLGLKFLINKNGIIFKKYDEENYSIPVITGLSADDVKNCSLNTNNKYTEAVLKILDYGNTKDSVFKNSSIKEIKIDREIGIVLLINDKIKKIIMGLDNYKYKFKRLKNIIDYFSYNNKNGLIEITSINFNNKNRIVVTPTKTKKARPEQERG